MQCILVMNLMARILNKVAFEGFQSKVLHSKKRPAKFFIKIFGTVKIRFSFQGKKERRTYCGFSRNYIY